MKRSQAKKIISAFIEDKPITAQDIKVNKNEFDVINYACKHYEKDIKHIPLQSIPRMLYGKLIINDGFQVIEVSELFGVSVEMVKSAKNQELINQMAKGKTKSIKPKSGKKIKRCGSGVAFYSGKSFRGATK